MAETLLKIHPFLLLLLLDGGGQYWLVLVHRVQAGHLLALPLLRLLAPGQGGQLGEGVFDRGLPTFVRRRGGGRGGGGEGLLCGEAAQLLEGSLGPRFQLSARR